MAELEPGFLAFGEDDYYYPRVQVFDLVNTSREVSTRCTNFNPLTVHPAEIQLDATAVAGGNLQISGRITSSRYNEIFLTLGFLRPEVSTVPLGNQGCRVSVLEDAFSVEELSPRPNGEFSFTFPLPPGVDGLSMTGGAVATDFTGYNKTKELRILTVAPKRVQINDIVNINPIILMG